MPGSVNDAEPANDCCWPACSRSGHRKNLNPVPIFARFGEPIFNGLAVLARSGSVIFSVIFFPRLTLSQHQSRRYKAKSGGLLVRRWRAPYGAKARRTRLGISAAQSAFSKHSYLADDE